MIRPQRLAWATLIALAPMSHAQDQPAQEPVPKPAPELVLRELLVLQTDRYDTTANNPALISTTLFNPIKHNGRAKRLTADGAYDYAPMPLGLITFEGQASEGIRLRLTLNDGRDTFHAHWPGNAITGKQSIEWPKLSPADESDRVVPVSQEEDWLDPLRQSEDRLWLQSRQGQFKERFLLYDASFRFAPALTLNLTNNDYMISSQVPERAAPPMTVMLRKTDGAWASDELPAPWKQPQMPIAKKLGAANKGVDLDQALTPITDLLATRGYNEREIELALGMIASAGLETSEMSLVYVLPVGVIDEHIQLQIKPKPDRVIRTTIVVVNNVDPELGSRINALLDDLGSDQWIVRERAQKQLLLRGQAAIKKVQQLKDHEDPEVAFRARQILDAFDWTRNANR
jgi:hypothetical protein